MLCVSRRDIQPSDWSKIKNLSLDLSDDVGE